MFKSKEEKSSLVILANKKMLHELFTVFGAARLESYKIAWKNIYIYLIAASCIVKENLNPFPYIPTSQNHINKIKLV